MIGYHTRISHEEHQAIKIACPYCHGNMHQYSLTIERTDIMFCESEDFEPIYHPLVEESYTRVFICPETQKEFKAGIILLVSKERIVDNIKITAHNK